MQGTMWPDALAEPLRGKTSLWKVIWIYGFGASVVYTLLGWMFVPETPLGITVYFLFGLALGILQSVMLWQCAYNSRFPGGTACPMTRRPNQALQATPRRSLRMPGYPRSKSSLGAPERDR
jgi:hypothetical protein